MEDTVDLPVCNDENKPLAKDACEALGLVPNTNDCNERLAEAGLGCKLAVTANNTGGSGSNTSGDNSR